MLTGYILWTYSVCIRYLVLAYHGQSAAGCVFFFAEPKSNQRYTRDIVWYHECFGPGMLNAIKPKNVAKECKMTETKESKAMQVANWLTEKAVGGVGPLSSAEDLALEYLNNRIMKITMLV